MIKPSDIVANLSDEELKVACRELLEWRDTGILTEGIARRVHTVIERECGVEFSLSATEKTLLFEVAKRYGVEG